MDRTEFLNNLFIMFPQNFNEFNVSMWREQYEFHLSPHINYDGLNRQFMGHHNSVSSAPTPTELRDIARSLNLIHIPRKEPSYMPSKPAPPPPEFYEAKKRLMKKLGMAV